MGTAGRVDSLGTMLLAHGRCQTHHDHLLRASILNAVEHGLPNDMLLIDISSHLLSLLFSSVSSPRAFPPVLSLTDYPQLHTDHVISP